MITEFTLKVYGDTETQAEEEMGEITSSMLILMRIFTGSHISWECIEDVISPDPAWVPGFGASGEIQGFKAYRKFQPSDEKLG